VPKTVGLRSEEDGLPDYQHPRRHGGNLHPSMDNFSTLVIWTSLYALTIDPTLWGRWVRNDDERLLFCKADFARPNESKLIRELLSFRDHKINSAVEAIISAAAAPSLDQVPHLVDVVEDVASQVASPWWLPEVTASAPAINSGHDEPKPLPPWIASPTAEALQPVKFKGGTIILSLFTATSVVSVALAGLLGFTGTLAVHSSIAWGFVICMSYFILFHLAFVMRPEVVSKFKAKKKLSEALVNKQRAAVSLTENLEYHLKSITEHERMIEASEENIKELDAALDVIKNRMAERVRVFERSQAEKRNRAEKAKLDAIARTERDRTSAKSQYESLRRKIEEELKSAESECASLLNRLSSTAERDRKFIAKLDEFTRARMAKVPIRDVAAPGVNLYELERSGFHTLADFVGVTYEHLKHSNGKSYKVRGIGYVRAQQMEGLRKKAAEKIRLKVPAAERDAINSVIDTETRAHRMHFESIRHQARTKAAAANVSAKANFDRDVAEASRIEDEAKQVAKAVIESLSAEHSAFMAEMASEERLESGPITRQLWSLQSVVNPARHVIETKRIVMEKESHGVKVQLAKAAEDLEAARREVARYAAITHTGLIKFVFS
jgi:hypothetical protein